jgi:group I intron endonuclease
MGYASQAGRARTSEITLYIVTNFITNKIYVGITSYRNINRRLSEHFYAAKKKIHNGAFYKAINKYGREPFSIRAISKHSSRLEAYEAEIAYIKEHAPEYNSTLGGDGARGHLATEKVKETNKRIHSGNKYRLGAGHSDETKAMLSDLGHQNIHKFKLYSALGPKSMAKKIICLETGDVFESASEAARHHGVAKSAVIELCLKKRNRKTVGGLRFQYVEAA